MPVALIIAIAASLGLHAAALFGPELDLSTEPEPPPLIAELRPLPPPPVLPVPRLEPVAPPEKPALAKPRPPRRKVDALAPAATVTPVLSVPQASLDDGQRTAPASGLVAEPAPELEPELPNTAGQEAPAATAEPSAAPFVSRLPSRGVIHYRVDRGDSNFEIGVARNEWEIIDGRYRLRSVVETTGLVWLFKAYRIEMESQGTITADGLQPDSFALSRNGQASKEKAFFDWQAMKLKVGNEPEQALANGTQDLLSFNYQLGYLPNLAAGGDLSIATGRKYGVYHLEVLGDELISLPAGEIRTLHLRAPGENTTELWLAYDYLLLPVKIRHVDKKGGSIVQVATTIQLSPE